MAKSQSNLLITIIATAILSLQAMADPYDSCLYCRRMDRVSHFLTSYSYCIQNEECLANAWNYLDYPCGTGWRRGRDVPVEECKADEYMCPDFDSFIELAGEERNVTWSLPNGAMCKVRIDATQFVGRVIFDDVSDLGVELDGYSFGDVITVDGDIQTI